MSTVRHCSRSSRSLQRDTHRVGAAALTQAAQGGGSQHRWRRAAVLNTGGAGRRFSTQVAQGGGSQHRWRRAAVLNTGGAGWRFSNVFSL